MRKAQVFIKNIPAGILEELDDKQYCFTYFETYQGPPVSLTMPTHTKAYAFKHFPAFFEGLLPEGMMLEALLRKYKLDRNDYFGQLLTVGHDVVGAVSIEALT